MLLTRRPINISTPHGTVSDGICDYEKDGNLVTRSKTIVKVSSPLIDTTGGLTLTSAVHEGGHSFGLDHCNDRACIMYPSITPSEGFQLYETLISGEPFHGDCVEDLEIASYLALAAKLP